jgi:hypothetical protein
MLQAKNGRYNFANHTSYQFLRIIKDSIKAKHVLNLKFKIKINLYSTPFHIA